MLWWGRKLRKAGVLGMNARNVSYISKYNKRELYPLADDKLKFKYLAQAAGLGVPELFGEIASVGEKQRLRRILLNNPECVIKPAHGSGGEGVMVLEAGSEPLSFIKANGSQISFEEIRHYISNILHGMFSLGGQPDTAMLEYRIKVDPIFSHISYRGVPDIRIIIFQGVPVIAMMRLPTRESNGRANLHQGAIGAGINLATGLTSHGVHNGGVVTIHPDTGNSIEGVQIPHWDVLLTDASRCFDLTGLGYLGVDIVLDKTKGPMILEINARPGLAVQIANSSGLLGRLLRAEAGMKPGMTVAERLELGKSLAA